MKTRIYAFLTHLMLSGIIAIFAMTVVFFFWYPQPLDEAVGVTEIFLMLLGVDIVIGPIITLVIYKPEKPGLKFDLAVIAILQLAALIYGMATVFQGRPAFIVFSKDRFEISRISELDPDSVNLALQNANQAAIPQWTRPKWVAAFPSSNPKRNETILYTALQGGPDWPYLPELFVPLQQAKEQVLAKAKPLQELRLLHNNTQGIETLNNWKDTEVKWLPLRGKVKNMVVLVDAYSATVIKILDIDPWSGS